MTRRVGLVREQVQHVVVQLAVVVDDPVRTEFVHRHGRVSETDRDAWNRGTARRGDIGRAVSDHDGAAATAAATVCVRWAGSGLETPKESPPAIAANLCARSSSRSRSRASFSYLLVQTASVNPLSARVSSAASTPSKGRLWPGYVGAVVLQERGVHARYALVLRRLSLSAKGVLDHRACPQTDAFSCRFGADRVHAFRFQRGVQGHGQVGQGIDEGAIEVEDDDAGVFAGHGDRASCARPVCAAVELCSQR